MKEIPKMVGGLLVIALLLAHFFLIALFTAPSDKLIGLLIKGNTGFLMAEEVPDAVEAFLVTNKVSVDGDYELDSSSKAKLIFGILQLRKEHFMTNPERLALDMNLLNYGGGIIGIKSGSEYYYRKPLTVASDKEWITLVNLQKIFSKK
ncbi:MAG TPA: hypothetical protein ENK70_02440 [Methylophaga sp.]|nr:hypothetical protein [Methylophaga sp.]